MILLLTAIVVAMGVALGTMWRRLHQLEDVVLEIDEAVDELWADIQEMDRHIIQIPIPVLSTETVH